MRRTAENYQIQQTVSPLVPCSSDQVDGAEDPRHCFPWAEACCPACRGSSWNDQFLSPDDVSCSMRIWRINLSQDQSVYLVFGAWYFLAATRRADFSLVDVVLVNTKDNRRACNRIPCLSGAGSQITRPTVHCKILFSWQGQRLRDEENNVVRCRPYQRCVY